MRSFECWPTPDVCLMLMSADDSEANGREPAGADMAQLFFDFPLDFACFLPCFRCSFPRSMSLLPNNGGNITTAAAATTTTTLAASNEAVTKGSPASLLPLNHNHPFLVLPDDVLHTLFTHLLLLTPPPLLHTNNRQGQGGESQRHWLAACLAVNRAWLAAGLPLLWKRIDCFSDDWDALKHLLMLSSSSTSNNFNSATTTTTTTAAAASLVNNTTSSQSRKLLVSWYNKNINE